MTEVLFSILFVGFGLARLYFVNKVYLAFSEYKPVKAKLLDARIVNEEVSFYYEYKVENILIGGRAFNNPKVGISDFQMNDMFKKPVSPDNQKEIDIFYNQEHPSDSIIEAPSWKWPLDAIFFTVVPISYLIMEIIK